MQQNISCGEYENMHPEKYKYVYSTRLEAENPFINLNRMAP